MSLIPTTISKNEPQDITYVKYLKTIIFDHRISILSLNIAELYSTSTLNLNKTRFLITPLGNPTTLFIHKFHHSRDLNLDKSTYSRKLKLNGKISADAWLNKTLEECVEDETDKECHGEVDEGSAMVSFVYEPISTYYVDR